MQQRYAAADKTFRWCTEEILKAKSSEWKNSKHRQQWGNSLETYAMPHIGHLTVSLIDLAHVLACLEPIWSSKSETASRLRGRMKSALDWATVRKYRSDENLARWRGHLDKVLAAPPRSRRLSTTPRSWSTACRHSCRICAPAKAPPVRGATWSEIDLDMAIWTIPAERMKAGTEHRVPLSDAALKLLKNAPPH